MYYFDPELVKSATDLLKECKDLTDAAKDEKTLADIINDSNYKFKTIYELQALDQQMREKYPAINAMQILANAVSWIKIPAGQKIYNLSIEEIERLKFDRFGILAHALKSAKRILDYTEFFDKSKIVNSGK